DRRAGVRRRFDADAVHQRRPARRRQWLGIVRPRLGRGGGQDPLKRFEDRHRVQITKLRLSGFKSFVDATELAIEPGITGIVGPNGCGKSNLVEALRWVMGEASARRL